MGTPEPVICVPTPLNKSSFLLARSAVSLRSQQLLIQRLCRSRYAFDEAGVEYEPAVRLLFGAIKRHWPSVKTLAVLNWDPTDVVDVVDIWVVLCLLHCISLFIRKSEPHAHLV